MDLKYETNVLDRNLYKKIGCLKKIALKMNFGCESYALLKKGTNGNQRAKWKVEFGPHGDNPIYLAFPIR
jgi:hypothetical protein